MRPLYETSADLNGEADVAKMLEDKWSCKFVKLPIRYHLDFVISRNDVALAYAELKIRKYSMERIGSMGGYMMSVGKWAAAKQLCEASLIPFILIVKTPEGLYQMKETKFSPDSVSVRGRTDRNDWQDIEPCVMLNVDKFKKITE